MKTTTQLAREAVLVQDACNLRGVLLSWHKALCNENIARGGQHEQYLNILYLSKVTSLLRATTDGIGSVTIVDPDGTDDFRAAYGWARNLSDPSPRPDGYSSKYNDREEP